LANHPHTAEGLVLTLPGPFALGNPTPEERYQEGTSTIFDSALEACRRTETSAE